MVRGGSIRVPNKNFKPFAGTTLLELKIKQLKRIPELDGIIVNSDSDHMLGIARTYDVETVKRADYYASSDVSIHETMKNIAETSNCDILCVAHCTSPLMLDSSISGCISAFRSLDAGYDSVMTVNQVKEFLYEGERAINFDPAHQPRSQDIKTVCKNSACHVISRDLAIKVKNKVGNRPLLYHIDRIEGMDIDDQLDFDICEFLYQKRQNDSYFSEQSNRKAG